MRWKIYSITEIDKCDVQVFYLQGEFIYENQKMEIDLYSIINSKTTKTSWPVFVKQAAPVF